MNMMTIPTDYLQVLFFSLIGGLLSLVGGVLLLGRKSIARKLATYATPFAAGALLAAAFFDLLPEAIEQTAGGAATRWVLLGIVLFFILEHFIHWFHHNHHHDDEHKSAVAPLIIIGDSIHNFIDGIAIGAAFLLSPATGIITALAVATHEIPQEISDFGLLMKHGYTRKKVLLINGASALMSTVGALVTYSVGLQASLPVGELLAITAGLFIYIAASDLIPEIHSAGKKVGKYVSIGLLLAGIVVVGGLAEVVHEYIEPAHSDQPSCISFYSKDGENVLWKECQNDAHDRPDDERGHSEAGDADEPRQVCTFMYPPPPPGCNE